MTVQWFSSIACVIESVSWSLDSSSGAVEKEHSFHYLSFCFFPFCVCVSSVFERCQETQGWYLERQGSGETESFAEGICTSIRQGVGTYLDATDCGEKTRRTFIDTQWRRVASQLNVAAGWSCCCLCDQTSFWD